MLDSTVDQENSAIQGLLALRDFDSFNGSNKSTSPLSFVTTPELNKISEIASVSKIPSDCNKPIPYMSNEIKVSPRLAHYQTQAHFIRHDQQYQANPTYDLQQKQQAHRDQQIYYAQQAFNAQQICHSHQFQVVHPPHQVSHIRLPSIQEMLSRYPSSYHNIQSVGNVMPTHMNNDVPEKYPGTIINRPHIQRCPIMSSEILDKHNVYIEARNKKVELCQHYQKRYSAEVQLKHQHMPQHNHHIETKVLLQSHETHKCMENIKALSDSELESFFSSLRQHYRDEYDKELKEQRENRSKSDSTEQKNNNETGETDTEDEGSDYRISSDNTHGSNINTVFINSNKKRTKIESSKSSNSSIEKPRWTTEEKLELLDAIIKYKSLDVMATFDWGVIGADTGRIDKACKDQWRRSILKLFREYVSKL